MDQARGAAVFVNGDRESLRTALLNVLDNAVKYSPGGVHITAELTALQRGFVLLRVIDTGVGIPPAQLKRVFHRFYRVGGHSVAKVKGTGLGLFIVRAIARQHGGDATAQSYGEGRGTTITLTLPLLLPGKLCRTGQGMSEESPLIALVEDEEHLADALLFNLKAEGYHVHHEADGEAALDWLLHTPERPRAVLLDVMLPGMDGFCDCASTARGQGTMCRS